MDILMQVLAHPFTWGLLVGLIFAAWAFFSGWAGRRALRRDVKRLEGEMLRLKDHIRTSTELNAEGTKALENKVTTLEEQNKNLQITVAELKNKPDRAEIQKLYVLDKAAELMTSRAPGFAPAWQSALQEAQAELDKTSTGVLPFLRRIIHPSLSASTPPPPTLPPPAP